MHVSISTGDWLAANAGLMLIAIVALLAGTTLVGIAITMAIRNRAPLHEHVFWAAEPSEAELDRPTAEGAPRD